jgi:hypothetical protein
LPDRIREQSRDAVSKAVAVSGKAIYAATKVLDSGNKELTVAVDAGQVAVSRAARSGLPTTGTSSSG